MRQGLQVGASRWRGIWPGRPREGAPRSVFVARRCDRRTANRLLPHLQGDLAYNCRCVCGGAVHGSCGAVVESRQLRYRRSFLGASPCAVQAMPVRPHLRPVRGGESAATATACRRRSPPATLARPRWKQRQPSYPALLASPLPAPRCPAVLPRQRPQGPRRLVPPRGPRRHVRLRRHGGVLVSDGHGGGRRG